MYHVRELQIVNEDYKERLALLKNIVTLQKCTEADAKEGRACLIFTNWAKIEAREGKCTVFHGGFKVCAE